MSVNDPKQTLGRWLEQPGQAPLDGVVLHAVAELAGVRDASGRVLADGEVEARVDEGAILGQREQRL